MSLPSQSSRVGMRGGAVSSRRRRKGPMRALMPVLVLGAIVAIVWFVLPKSGSDSGSTGGTDELASGDQPVEIAQGQPGEQRDAGNRNTSMPSAPPRSLPGTETPAADEVDRALEVTQPASNTTADRGSTSGNADNAGGMLDRALDRDEPVTLSQRPAGEQTPRNTNNSNSNLGTGRVRLQIDTARRLVAENDRVGARALLSRVLRDPNLDPDEANLVRDELTEINEQLVFGRLVEPGDMLVEEYKVVSGDSLSRISSRRELASHWKLIQRVNGLSDPTRIRLGQTLKLVRGPFHAVVDKSDFRLDVWHGPPSDPSRWVYIRSFDVGLGEFGGTPVGTFVVSANKLENPGWVNPRDSRERYEPNDPMNPIGEFWLGLRGVGESADVTGYGIHGTIEPDSVGQNRSMGCVRLRDSDIAMVYELLAERVSRVDIVP
ncbi:MAG: L,D-transpeptidase family protein [Phycisphaerales bacterium]